MIDPCKESVSDNDIILQKRPRNTLENVEYLLEDLKTMHDVKGEPLSIIAVTSPYHLKRIKLMLLHLNRINPTT